MGKIGGRDYWLDAGGRWRSGAPPSDWRRDDKGRWHPTAVPAAVRVPERPRPPERSEPSEPSEPSERPEPPVTAWQPPIEPAGRAPGADPRHVGGPPPTGTMQVKDRVRKRGRERAPR
jgi:hypothetical protein